MPNSSIQQKAVEVMILINTGITNLRLYPSSSAVIADTIDRLYEMLNAILDQESSIIYSESARDLLVYGEAISKSDLEKPQVNAFLGLMLYFGIRSLTFEKGLEKRELQDFLEIMGRKREAVRNDGGLEKLMREANLTHIMLDKKIYLTRDEESQLLAGLDAKDYEILQYLTDSNLDPDLFPENLKEMAKDAEWVTQIFQAGMNNVMERKGASPDAQLSDNMARMFSILDKIVDKMDHEKMAGLVAKAIADLDAEMMSLVLTQNIDKLFDGKVFKQVLDQIDEEKFAEVAERIKALEGGQGSGKEEAGRKYNQLMGSDKGKQFQQKIDENEASEKDEKVRQLLKIERDIAPILRGDENAFMDKPMMASLSDIVAQLNAYEEHQKVKTLIRRLAEGLLSKNQNVRDEASEALVGIIGNLSPEGQKETIRELSGTLIKWIKLESSATTAYEKICLLLKDHIIELIRKKQYADCIPALDLFHLIAVGVLDKNDTAHAIATAIISELAAPEIMDTVLEDFSQVEGSNRDDAGRVFGRLGDASLNRLLDLLRDHDDSNERIRILHIFAEIGRPGIPVIRERIAPDEPWYFLRNLAYMLGRINSDLTAASLEPLLLNKNEKVRQEALKSLYRAGGSERGPVLLSILAAIDETFRMDVIDALGNLKYPAAAFPLIELLKERPLISTPARIELEERICIALGKIRSQEAVPILMEISKLKLFSRKFYHNKVKNAAVRALESIKTGK